MTCRPPKKASKAESNKPLPSGNGYNNGSKREKVEGKGGRAVCFLIGAYKLLRVFGIERLSNFRVSHPKRARYQAAPHPGKLSLSISGKVDLSNRGLKAASNASCVSLLLRVQSCFARVEQAEQAAHLFAYSAHGGAAFVCARDAGFGGRRF